VFFSRLKVFREVIGGAFADDAGAAISSTLALSLVKSTFCAAPESDT